MVNPDWLNEMYPFKPNYLKTQGGKLHYVDSGRGEVMLMLHGNPTWSFYYRNLVKEFQTDHRIIVPDHMGCGKSDKPQDYEYVLENHIKNVITLIDHLNIKSLTLVVHDWGGAIGFGLATRRPDLIKKIIILNTAAFTSDYIAPSINICKIPVLGERVIRHFNAFAWPATFMAVNKKMDKNIKKGYLYPYNNYKNRIATAKFVTDIPMNSKHKSYQTLLNIENNLDKVKCDKLILWGEKDFCFNDYFLQKWKKFYPEAKVKTFPEAGHYILEDATKEVIQEMRSFL